MESTGDAGKLLGMAALYNIMKTMDPATKAYFEEQLKFKAHGMETLRGYLDENGNLTSGIVKGSEVENLTDALLGVTNIVSDELAEVAIIDIILGAGKVSDSSKKLLDELGIITENITEAINENVNDIRVEAGRIINHRSKELEDKLKSIQGDSKAIALELEDFFRDVKSEISLIISKNSSLISEGVTDTLGGLLQIAEEFGLDSLMRDFNELLNDVINGKGFSESIMQQLGEKVEEIIAGANRVTGGISDVSKGIADTIKSVIESTVNEVKETISAITPNFKNIFNDMGDMWDSFTVGFGDLFSSFTSNVFEMGHGIFSSIGDRLGDLGDGFWDAITGVGQFWNGLRDTFSWEDNFGDNLKSFFKNILNLDDLFDMASDAMPIRRDPLVLDLNGDGITTISSGNGVYFDLDVNGFAERTGWINRDDGFLVFDRNQDGIINNGLELFGDGTKLKNGAIAANGFEALSENDDNKDGIIDKSDSIFNKLRVWKDINGDGFSQTSELLLCPV